MTRDKRPQLSVKNKTDLRPNNASCKRWDTLLLLNQWGLGVGWACAMANVAERSHL